MSDSCFFPRDILQTELTGNHLLVAIALADYCNPEGVCKPSCSAIMLRTKLSESRVRAIIADLEKTGLFKRVSRAAPNGRQTSNYYFFDAEWIEASKARNSAKYPELAAKIQRGVQRAKAEEYPTGGSRVDPTGGSRVDPTGGSRVINIEDSHKETTHPMDGDAKPAKKGHRLPADWRPDASLQKWTREKTGWDDATATDQLERFIDHWTAASGQSASKRDWNAAWRTWVRKAMDFDPSLRPLQAFPFTPSPSARH